MIPTLHKDLASMTTWGLGGLGDALDIEIQWALNGAYELVMQYPVTGRRFGDLAPRRLIRAGVGPDGEEDVFRIYRITAPLAGVCMVYARHLVYDLMGYTARPFETPGPAEAMQMLQGGAAVQGHEFQLSTDLTSETPYRLIAPRSIWHAMGGRRGSLLDVYGGEWRFKGQTARLTARIGDDLGVRVRYGVNLKSLEQDTNIANTWTAVHPYWLSADEETLVMLPEETISAGEFDHVRVMELDLSQEWPEPPTVDQLRARARRYISDNQIGVPAVGMDVDFVPLNETVEYAHLTFLQSVRGGDTVTVEFPTAYNEDGSPRAFAEASARATETAWLPLQDRYRRIRLGDKRADFVSAVVQLEKDTAWNIKHVG